MKSAVLPNGHRAFCFLRKLQIGNHFSYSQAPQKYGLTRCKSLIVNKHPLHLAQIRVCIFVYFIQSLCEAKIIPQNAPPFLKKFSEHFKY